MRDRKGQALIEFIIIIPILILLISCIIDFGCVIYEKYQLQNDLDTISEMYVLNKNDDLNKYLGDIKAEMVVEKDNEYITFTLNKDVDINTIIVNNIIGKKYHLSVHKTILEGDNNG